LNFAFASLNSRLVTATSSPDSTLALEAKDWLRVFYFFVEYGADPFAFCECPYLFNTEAENEHDKFPSL
jgi:hypothetical protein